MSNESIDQMTNAAKQEAVELLKQDSKEPKKHAPKPRPAPMPKAKWQEDLKKIKDSGTLKKSGPSKKPNSSTSKPKHKTDHIKVVTGTSAKPKIQPKEKEVVKEKTKEKGKK